jgi:RNA polymerase sigma factor (sigma-70 family)
VRSDDATDGEQHGRVDVLAGLVAVGDATQFHELFTLTNTTLLRRAAAVLGCSPTDLHRAEDVVQESWMKFLRKPDQFSPGRPFLPWMYRVVSNTAKDSHRHQAVRKEDLTSNMIAVDMACVDLTPEQVAERQATRDELWAQIGKLPQRQKQVMIHGFYENLSTPEIAAVMGITPGNVRTAMSRAMAKLKPLVEALDAQPESSALCVPDPPHGPSPQPTGDLHA